MLYGKSAANAAMAVKTEDELSEGSKSPGKAKEVDEVFTGIPELSSDFFASPFFRRFQIQREYPLSSTSPAMAERWQHRACARSC